jgi:hypothetical protein
MFWFLRKRIDVLAEADEFMESFGQLAYQEARVMNWLRHSSAATRRE